MNLEVLWRQQVGIGAEHLLLNIDGAIHADSLSVGEIEGTAYHIHYEIDCDANWNVQGVRVEDLLTHQLISLVRRHDGAWSDEEGGGLPELDGCTDVDIMFMPFTNTLPIRRLDLALGEEQEIAVVYIGLPRFSISRMDQRYTCLVRDEDGGRYRYESVKSGFTAELSVDTDGLVVDYPNIFTMDAKRRL
ncbi:MAG TPA: putative glycolipid-binding domain-containing protein [Anaerolineales bacterium]|nr:putative glycolipid-binding domain-containing protein [Anaerolineales bacterium]